MKKEVKDSKKVENLGFDAKFHNSTLGSSMSAIAYLRHQWKPDSGEIFDYLESQLEKFKKEGLSEVENMLYCQAQVLQTMLEGSIFHYSHATSSQAIETWSKIVLKTQKQCRQTLTALAHIKNPRQTAFIKQQNNAVNQQVNNCSAEISEKINHENELLEVPYVSLDNGTTFTTISTDPAVETMAKVDRPKDG